MVIFIVQTVFILLQQKTNFKFMKKYVKEGFSCNCFASLKKYVRAQSIKIRNQ